MLPVSLIRVSETNLSILPLLSRNPGLSDYWQNTDISAKNFNTKVCVKIVWSSYIVKICKKRSALKLFFFACYFIKGFWFTGDSGTVYYLRDY